MENFALNLGINRTSLGQVSICLLREIYKRGLTPNVFPIGEVDLTTHRKDEDFNSWLTGCIRNSLLTHDRETPILKNWHISNSLESLSKNQFLFTYLETDTVTPTEKNILKNQSKVFVCNEYLKNVLEKSGAENVVFCPLGFDSESFYNTKKKCYQDDRIVWNLLGKFEQRKAHARVIRAWMKKYANNKNHVLHLSIGNSFLTIEQNNQILNQIFEGKKPFNINILPITATNKEYNDVINAGDIVIDAAHNENWSLPSFQSVAIGKQAVLHNVAGVSQWATKENSCLFESNGKMIDAADGMFFNKGGPFSQGFYFDWDEDSLISAFEKVEPLAKKYNFEGEKLQQKFSWGKTLDIILENIK